MKKCNFCKLNIIDNTEACPLCGGVLEGNDSDFETYPDIVKKTKVVNLIFRICLFMAIVTNVLCIQINYSHDFSFKWSFIVVGCFVYALFFLYLFMKEGTGYRMRTFMGALGGILLLVLIDFICGFTRWSFNYALPAAILGVDISFIILMIVNHRNWQSYILLMGIMFLCSFVPVILYYTDIITNPILTQVTFLFTLFSFLAVIIFGGSRVRHEIKRRFYIK